MKKSKKSQSQSKSKAKKDIQLYSKGDCLAINDANEPEIVVINQNVMGSESALKAIPMERLDKNYFLYPKNDKEEVWVYNRNVLGTISMEITENKRCFFLDNGEVERIQKAKGEDSEPFGEHNMTEIRQLNMQLNRKKKGKKLPKLIAKVLNKKLEEEEKQESRNKGKKAEGIKRSKSKKQLSLRSASKRQPHSRRYKDEEMEDIEEDMKKPKRGKSTRSATKRRVEKEESSSEDEVMESEEEAQVESKKILRSGRKMEMPQKAVKKISKSKPKRGKKPQKKPKEESSEEEEVKAIPKRVRRAKTVEKEVSEEESEEIEEKPKKRKTAKRLPKKRAKSPTPEESSEEEEKEEEELSSSSESEEESEENVEPEKKPKKGRKGKAQKKKNEKELSVSESESIEEPKKGKKTKISKRKESESEDKEESMEDIEQKPKRGRKGKAAKKEESSEKSPEESEEKSQEKSESEEKEESPKKVSKKKSHKKKLESPEESKESEEEPKKAKGRKKKTKDKSSKKEKRAKSKKKNTKSKKPDKPDKSAKKLKPQRKLEPNPDLKEILSNPILEPEKSKFDFPEDNVSVLVNNRKPIYFVCKGDVKGLKKLIKSSEEVSTFFQHYSAEVNKNALHYAMEKKNNEIIELLLTELENETQYSRRPKRAVPESIDLKFGDSGTQNPFQFGFRTHKVAMSRGGKEGNMAFAQDTRLPTNRVNGRAITNLPLPSEYVERLLKLDFMRRNYLSENIKEILRSGNCEAAKIIFEKAPEAIVGISPLHHDVLLKTGAPQRVLNASILKKIFRDNITPLHVACINPNIEPLKKLLSINPAYDTSDAEGYKPVHYAAACKKEEPLKLLISKRIVNLNSGNNRLITPLMVACKYGREHNVKLLLDESKKLLEELKNDNEDEENKEQTDKKSYDFANSISKLKETPAHYAAENGSVKVLKYLLDAKANFEILSSKGKTPLMIATTLGHLDCVKFLIEKAKVNPLVRNKKGKTAATFAVINGQLHVLSYLLKIGMSPNGYDSSLNTLLHYAAGYGWFEIVKYLIDAGADINAFNSWCSTPVSIAFLKCHFNIVSYLMKLPNINAGFVDSAGRTLIMQFLEKMNKNVVKQLKFIGDNTNINLKAADNKGMNAMHYLAKLLVSIDNEDQEKKDDNNIFVNKKKKDEDEEGEDGKEMDDGEPKEERKLTKKEKRKNFNELLIECGEYFLSKGVDLNKSSNNGTPLILSLNAGNKEFSLWLLKNGADIKFKDNEGKNLLYTLTTAAKLHGIKKILKHISKIHDYKKTLQEMSKEFSKEGFPFSYNIFVELSAENNTDKVKQRVLKYMEFLISNEIDFGMLQGLTEKGAKKCQKAREQGCSEKEVLALSLEKKDPISQNNSSVNRFMGTNFNRKGNEVKKEETKNTFSVNQCGMYREICGYKFDENYKYYTIGKSYGNILHDIACLMKDDSPIAETAITMLCNTRSDFDKKNINGITPLMLALISEKLKLTSLLLEHKFDINVTNGTQNISCIHLAARFANDQIISQLLKQGANINAVDVLGNTPLHYAAERRNLETTKALLDAGANPNAKNNMGNNVLHVSIANYCNSTINTIAYDEFLIERGADTNAVNKKLMTPFFYAFILAGFDAGFGGMNIPDPIEVTHLFLSLPKYDLNLKDSDGNTVLHFACSVGTTLSILRMVKAGAKLDIANNEKNTPLGVALLKGNTQIAIYLLSEATQNEAIYEKKELEKLDCFINKAENKERIKKAMTSYIKRNLFWFAMKLNDDGLLFMLRSNNFFQHKAIKIALKNVSINFAIKIFESGINKFKSYITKKDGMNLYCYFVRYADPIKLLQMGNTYEMLHHIFMKAGIDPFKKSKTGLTTIHAAAMNPAKPILEKLLANLSSAELEKQINVTAKMVKDSNIEYTPITYLVYANDYVKKSLEIIELQEENFNLNYGYGLSLASMLGGPGMAKPMNVGFGNFGRSGFSYNEPNDKFSAIAYLLQLCADKKVTFSRSISFDPKTPNDKFVNFYLYAHLFKGIDIVNTTLLHYAVMLANLEMAACFIGLKLDINAKDSEGRTPLMYAVLSGKAELIELLVGVHKIYRHKFKVDIDAKDNNGKTAIMLCLEQAFIAECKIIPVRADLFRELLAAKPDLTVKDKDGKSFIEQLNALEGNEAYVEIMKELLPSFKPVMNSIKKSSHSPMTDKSDYNYEKDCEQYLEKKYKKKQYTLSKDKAVKVDTISGYKDKCEVVKGDKQQVLQQFIVITMPQW